MDLGSVAVPFFLKAFDGLGSGRLVVPAHQTTWAAALLSCGLRKCFQASDFAFGCVQLRLKLTLANATLIRQFQLMDSPLGWQFFKAARQRLELRGPDPPPLSCFQIGLAVW